METKAKGKNKKKNYKKFSKSNKKMEDRYDVMKERPGGNDVSWYGDSRLIEAAGRINFTNALGKPVGWMIDNSGAAQITKGTGAAGGIDSVPGVMSIEVECGIGFTSNQTDAANLFMRNIYSWIRHFNSGHVNYDAPDLALYFMAIDQIYTILTHCQRIYGVARTYSSANRYLPTAVLAAMACDPYASGQELYPNLATYRSQLINLMVKAATLVVPQDIKLIKRHMQLFENVYADGSTAKAQLYVFRPYGYKKYVESGSGHTGGYLEHTSIPNSISAWNWLYIAEQMIDAVVSSEDMNIMSGDIFKAYGADSLYKMTYTADDYTVAPIYNSEILLQIHNAVICGTPWTDADLDIYQDPTLNIIKYEPIFGVPVPYQSISPILDMPVENPTPDQVMIASRFMNTGSVGYDSTAGTSPYKYVPDSIGSEVVIKAHVYSYYFDNSNNWVLGDLSIMGGRELASSAVAWHRMAAISMFNWHFPVKYLSKTSATAWKFEAYQGELENYTALSAGDLKKLHDVALIGQFSVPLISITSEKVLK